MLKYFISCIFLLLGILTFAQDTVAAEQPKDSIQYLEPYGLRVGIDLGRLARNFYDDGYTGFEIAGDYRLTYKLYLAAEIGNEDFTFEEVLSETPQEPIYNFTTNGSYIKLGVDVNSYDNWFGENNSIFFGGRYAFSTHSQTVNSFRFFNSNRFFNPDGFAQPPIEPQEFGGRSASWLEFLVGFKAELFANIFMGASIRVGALITGGDDDVFPDLWIPGFNRVTDGSRFGIGYNYTLTYFLPFYKKQKKKQVERVRITE